MKLPVIPEIMITAETIYIYIYICNMFLYRCFRWVSDSWTEGHSNHCQIIQQYEGWPHWLQLTSCTAQETKSQLGL